MIFPHQRLAARISPSPFTGGGVWFALAASNHPGRILALARHHPDQIKHFVTQTYGPDRGPLPWTRGDLPGELVAHFTATGREEITLTIYPIAIL